jgi:glutamate racemase
VSGLLGLFDSGVGGLTVLRQVLARRPGQRCLYLGDTARVPYGQRSPRRSAPSPPR